MGVGIGGAAGAASQPAAKLDVGGTIDLDSDGGQIKLSDAGTQIGLIQMDSGQNLIFRSMVSDKDISNWASFGGPPKTALYNTLYESRCQVFTYNCVSSTEANQTLNLSVDKYVQYSIHR